jgi:hypothetical protein
MKTRRLSGLWFDNETLRPKHQIDVRRIFMEFRTGVHYEVRLRRRGVCDR